MANNSFYSPMDPVSINFGIPVDRSGLVHAQAMSDAGETAKNMLDVFGKYKKGVALNEIDADYEKAINDYYSQSPTYQNLLNKQIKNFEDQLKTPTMDTNIQRITADLDEARAKLSKARDQGTITPLELETRLDQLTREKVAANPAFRNEIISHAAQTKDMLGISQIMANDTKIYNDIIQAEKEARQQMERDVNTYHINLNDPKFKNLDAKKEYITREFQGFFRYIGAVLQCIQGSNYILSNEERANVSRDFTKVVLDSITEDLLVGSGQTDDTRADARKRADVNKAQMKKQRGGFELDMDGDIDFSHQSGGEILCELIGKAVMIFARNNS